MSALPKPTVSFTIPSLYDGKLLACRIYLPEHMGSGIGHYGAIVAHPYATLGGNYDNPVVGSVGEAILSRGWVLVTFNFRGAGDSEGRTSWTGRAECSDYASIAGFLILFLRELSLQVDNSNSGSEELQHGLHLMLGGYSYGSMVASKCPPVPSILAPFGTSPLTGPAQEISLRATDIATKLSNDLNDAKSSLLETPQNTLPRTSSDHTLSMGGSEVLENKAPKPHHHSARESLDHVAKKLHLGKREGKHAVQDTNNTTTHQFDFPINTYYLLVCPILPPISTLIALPFWKSVEDHDSDKMLSQSPTLAVYGNNDNFTAAKKLTSWGTVIQKTNPNFTMREIDGAGHFWIEEGTLNQLVVAVKDWLKPYLKCNKLLVRTI